MRKVHRVEFFVIQFSYFQQQEKYFQKMINKFHTIIIAVLIGCSLLIKIECKPLSKNQLECNNEKECSSQNHWNGFKFVPDSLECKLCVTLLPLIKTKVQNNDTSMITKIADLVCELAKVEDKVVCTQVIALFQVNRLIF